MSREKVVFRIRTLIYDLNLLQNRLVSVLFDILYPDDAKSRILMEMRENKEFMERLLADIDKIIELIEAESRP